MVNFPTAVALPDGSLRCYVRGLGGNSWFSIFVSGPLIVPTIIYAIAVLLFFSQLHVSGTFLGFVLAHTALASPYVVIIVSAALYRSDPSLELAAMNLGASRARAVWEVTLPSIRPALVAGAARAITSIRSSASRSPRWTSVSRSSPAMTAGDAPPSPISRATARAVSG